MIKAVDFLFDEGKKFLEDRRKRKESGKSPDENGIKDVNPNEKDIAVSPKENLILSKEDAKKEKIYESLWIKSEEKVKHLSLC
jgi:hypothetical protein